MTFIPKIMPGDRVRVTGIMEDPNPLAVGSTGTVTEINTFGGEIIQIMVDWDDRRSLMLLPEDPFEVIGNNPNEKNRTAS